MLGALAVAVWLGLGAGLPHTTASQAAPRTTAAVQRQPQAARPRAVALVVHLTGRLPLPVQDAAAANVGGRAILLGGLTAADASTDRILLAGTNGGRLVGHTPSALHDTAAAALGGSVYLFGGGTATAQLDPIVRFSGTGRLTGTVVGRLPAPSSDQAAAAIGGTAYVVGGYTGTRWLDTIVAWRPGSGARVVAHLPSPSATPPSPRSGAG